MDIIQIKLNKDDMKRLVQIASMVEEESKNTSNDELDQQVTEGLLRVLGSRSL